MTPKNKKKEMHKLVTLSHLYLECLDNLKATNPVVIKFKNDDQIKIKIRPCEINGFKKHINLINKNCKSFS